MTTRSSRAAGEGRPPLPPSGRSGATTGDPSKCGAIVRGEFGIRNIVKARAQQDDDIETTRPLVVPEHFPRQPLGPVPAHGPAEAPGRNDAEPIAIEAVDATEQRQEPALRPPPPLLNGQEFRTPPDPLGLSQPPIHRPARRIQQLRTLRSAASVPCGARS